MRVRIAPLLMTLTIVAGCQVRPPVEARADPYSSPQVSLAGNNLRRWTAVLPPSVQRDDAGNLLHVALPVRNTTNYAFTVDYQVSFFDANRRPARDAGLDADPARGQQPRDDPGEQHEQPGRGLPHLASPREVNERVWG